MNGSLAVRNGAVPTLSRSEAIDTGNGTPPSGRPRVLILAAGVGSGHLRAAEAVEAAFRQLHPEALVRNIDVLTLGTPMFRRCYGGMYLDCVNKAPLILRIAYNLMDRPRVCGAPSRLDRLRLFLEEINLRPFLELLRQPWDLVINTHFLPGEIIADLRRKNQLAVPQVMVTTDFETHHLWITEPCEHYFTATEEAALYLQKQGVQPEKLSVVGIPIHPAFRETKERAACRERHGLSGDDRPVVLLLAGGHGVGRIDQMFRALLEVEEPLQLVAVTGRNATAKRRLEGIIPPARHRVKVLGYSTCMDELLRAADLVMSKPGGLTTSEALACGTPMVIVDPVPGQEERNSDLLLENGAAIKGNHLLTLAPKVTALLRDPARLAELQANARRLGRPEAAFEVVQRSLALLGSSADQLHRLGHGAGV